MYGLNRTHTAHTAEHTDRLKKINHVKHRNTPIDQGRNHTKLMLHHTFHYLSFRHISCCIMVIKVKNIPVCHRKLAHPQFTLCTLELVRAWFSTLYSKGSAVGQRSVDHSK